MTRLIFAFILQLVGAFSAAADQARVIDGDTIAIGEETYRINGIDAPEHGQKCGSWDCGKDATKAMAKLVEGRTVSCRVLSKDGYGRLIADCDADGENIGAAMVEMGLAWAFVKYSDMYVGEEEAARKSKKGVWAGSFQTPWDYRAVKWTSLNRRHLRAVQSKATFRKMDAFIMLHGHLGMLVPRSPRKKVNVGFAQRPRLSPPDGEHPHGDRQARGPYSLLIL